jgi:hypothetical protein
MGVKPTREKPDVHAPDAARTDVPDRPGHDAPPHAVAGPTADPRAGETASQDLSPSAHDLELEARLVQHRQGTPSVDEWRETQRPAESGLADDPDGQG